MSILAKVQIGLVFGALKPETNFSQNTPSANQNPLAGRVSLMVRIKPQLSRMRGFHPILDVFSLFL